MAGVMGSVNTPHFLQNCPYVIVNREKGVRVLRGRLKCYNYSNKEEHGAKGMLGKRASEMQSHPGQGHVHKGTGWAGSAASLGCWSQCTGDDAGPHPWQLVKRSGDRHGVR